MAVAPVRRLGIGAVVLAAYVAVCMATIGLSDRHVRPLFEGVGPSSPYRWVKPPPLFAPGNLKPTTTSMEIPLYAMANPSQVASGDGQALVNVPAHGVAARPGARNVRFVFTPADPLALGHLPPGLRPAGNAYRITFTYEPTGGDASPLVSPGNLVLTVPEPVTAIAYSPDGRQWQTLPAQILGGLTTVGTSFSRSGFYVGAADAATAPPGAASTPTGGSEQVSVLLIAAGTALLAIALVVVPLAIRSRRDRGGGRPGTGRSRPRPGTAGPGRRQLPPKGPRR